MRILRTDLFLKDLDSQVGWYIQKTNLEIGEGIELVTRFVFAVDETLAFLSKNPEAGRKRAVRFSDLKGYRAFHIREPFGRFRVYYRTIEDQLVAERLLEGLRLGAADAEELE